MVQVALTTTDNPWDYFTEYDRWHHFDAVEHDYCTDETIARIAKIDPLLPPAILEDIWKEAIDFVCKLNVTGNYKKIFREV
jgi:hypothetical protein